MSSRPIRSVWSFAVAFFKDRRYLDELRSADLERLRLDHQQMGYANQTTRHMIGSLRGAIKYMAPMGYQVPTVEYPKIAHTKTRLRYLSFEEERRLLVAVDPRRSIKGLSARRSAHDVATSSIGFVCLWCKLQFLACLDQRLAQNLSFMEDT